ncbi:hypothetical protein DP939_31420 [Spongiactinospora rosea]|uniref:Tox-ART-HYD1 domain-containing protein n=1 Tax=Spongiactinospora rosea TaxID=2248750 RepID=A0A366LRI4_9ACTN|nr:hypothetical protein DP939_31420 [Spongiactinospora rosea]
MDVTSDPQSGNPGNKYLSSAPRDDYQVFWHYTRFTSMMSILRGLRLYPSLRKRNGRDARYGDGQYVSDIKPGAMSDAQLSYWLVRAPEASGRFTHYVGINVAELEIIQGREHVFVIPGREALDLTGRVVSWGANDDPIPPGGVAPRFS